jgi:hypothetical protein
MKRVLVILLVAAGLVLAPNTGSVNAQSSTSKRPPIEQPLVSEGEFAVELATALNLASSHDEAAAENSLAMINIAPRNGWISDYPMTPDIIAEVRESTARSASSGSLSISEADAARTVDNVSIAMNLPIEVAGEKYANESSSSSEYQSSSTAPPPEVSEYEAPANVEEYYDEYGPPIVSYYPPPSDYGYLYAWVPWPFWWGGFGFGGFFILKDFDRHDHNHRFSNHVSNANGTVSRVNAVTRATGTGTRNSSTLAGASRSTQSSRLSSANAQAGARAIMNHAQTMSQGAAQGYRVYAPPTVVHTPDVYQSPGINLAFPIKIGGGGGGGYGGGGQGGGLRSSGGGGGHSGGGHR